MALLACVGSVQASDQKDDLTVEAISGVGFIATAHRYPNVHFCGDNVKGIADFAKSLLNCVDRASAEKAANQPKESGFGAGFKKGFLNKKIRKNS